MSPLFGRRGRHSDEADELAGRDHDDYDDYDEQPAEHADRHHDGPFDLEDAPPGVSRLDFGAVWVPVLPGIDISIASTEPEGQGQVVGVVLTEGNSVLQLHAFAAPRNTPIWADVRTEIREQLGQVAGSASESDGRFGPELRARVPATLPDAAPGSAPTLQDARFLGVDGPRWFLRGLITGPAAVDRSAAHRLEEAFAQVVVVRGGEAMPPREMLPLRPPREAVEAHDAPGEGDDLGEPGAEAGTDERPRGMPMPERGPEITEIR